MERYSTTIKQGLSIITNCSLVKTSLLIGLAALAIVPKPVAGQALTMDGSSGVFLEPLANVVPASPGRFSYPTLSYHTMDAGPVAGNYINVSLESGFGNWLEFGYTRANHTDGGDPRYSQLFNYAGMNIFNAKAKVVKENAFGHGWMPAVAIGGTIRTNVPYVSQYFAHTNATNGNIYGVATKIVSLEKWVNLLLSVGVQGTNAEVYGYGGNATYWQARVFGAAGIPIVVKQVVVTPTMEVDQEPHHFAYVPAARVPTTLIYAVRMSRAPDAKWTIDFGTGRIANAIEPSIKLKVNNVFAVALDRRF